MAPKASSSKQKGGPPTGGKGGRGFPSNPTNRKPPQSKSKKDGLNFSVNEILKSLRRRKETKMVRVGSAVYLGAVLEYLTAEVLELSGNCAKDNKKMRIVPRHILLAVRNDDELNNLVGKATIPEGGVLPNIHSVLLPKTSKAGESSKEKAHEESQSPSPKQAKRSPHASQDI